ncbi:hypothetical protein [Sphingobacterium sp. SYP-B4668]|uniref:hypothetical protein n=1 Tax=Sphingobacterium sp. SYP-B4668 TaxID=2996035 RepID=UPI0022DD8892|nr:hypothetical protein [Sphingobacterium sp. SYP-B4668]
MSTVHLFDNSHPQSKGNKLGDLEKTVIINSLMQTSLAERDNNWVDDFVNNIDQANLTLAEPEVLIGSDGFPYFNLRTIASGESFKAFVIQTELDNILNQGFGVAINAGQDQSDWIFSHGDMVNLRLNGEFYTDRSTFSSKNEKTVITKDEDILIGQPAETILPRRLRNAIREFLVYSGIKNPKIALIARDYKDEELVRQDLVFNIIPMQFRTEKEFEAIMTTIGWFLPRHYSFIGLDELSLENGFQPL